MAAPDRLQMLLQQNAVTGIDFVYVHPDQTTLDIFFFRHDVDPQLDGKARTSAIAGACGKRDARVHVATASRSERDLVSSPAIALFNHMR